MESSAWDGEQSRSIKGSEAEPPSPPIAGHHHVPGNLHRTPQCFVLHAAFFGLKDLSALVFEAVDWILRQMVNVLTPRLSSLGICIECFLLI